MRRTALATSALVALVVAVMAAGTAAGSPYSFGPDVKVSGAVDAERLPVRGLGRLRRGLRQHRGRAAGRGQPDQSGRDRRRRRSRTAGPTAAPAG